MLYKSTYKGEEADSDAEEFHITMPFKHSEDCMREIHEGKAFESDESF